MQLIHPGNLAKVTILHAPNCPSSSPRPSHTPDGSKYPGEGFAPGLCRSRSVQRDQCREMCCCRRSSFIFCVRPFAQVAMFDEPRRFRTSAKQCASLGREASHPLYVCYWQGNAIAAIRLKLFLLLELFKCGRQTFNCLLYTSRCV